MKRFSGKASPPRLSRDADRLAGLARGLAESGSRVEDRYWESLIDSDLARLLDSGNEAGLNQALDALVESTPAAYEALLETAETNAESLAIEHDGRALCALLVAAPI